MYRPYGNRVQTFRFEIAAWRNFAISKLAIVNYFLLFLRLTSVFNYYEYMQPLDASHLQLFKKFIDFKL